MLVLAFGSIDRRPSPPPSIVILSDTGTQREGLPVLRRHQDPQRYVTLLTRGYSGRLLRLYRLVQQFTHPEREPQPAYLLLSQNQGGFPRFGFEIDGEAHPDLAYVDLHERSTLSGRAGAIDQIFPHELLHIIVRELAGEPPEGGANQVHAVGVRTDRITAFNEGFAEHAQVMAVDAADGAPDTRALASDTESRDQAFAAMADYRRVLSARWSIATKARMTFPFWFSRTEQVLRYHAVRDNLFAHDTVVPPRLRASGHVYSAYLIENVVPGDSGQTPKTPGRLLSTEGVVSALFVRLVTAPAIQRAYRDDGFYRRFSSSAQQLDGVDNAYLKIFAAIQKGGYDTAAILRAYIGLFPDEASALMEVVRATLYTEDLNLPCEIWLRNDRFHAGTTLFDQLRAVPRAHTFDLNASSAADLAGVQGMTIEANQAIRARAPFLQIEDVSHVAGVRPELVAELVRMHSAMASQRAANEEESASLSIRTILLPYVWRAVYVLIGVAVVAAFLYRTVRRVRWWRLALNGIAAALAGLVVGWTIDNGSGAMALLAPIVVFGLPATLWRAVRTRSGREAATVLAAWTLAALPAALAVRPIG
jgi:hypothetical protein